MNFTPNPSAGDQLEGSELETARQTRHKKPLEEMHVNSRVVGNQFVGRCNIVWYNSLIKHKLFFG